MDRWLMDPQCYSTTMYIWRLYQGSLFLFQLMASLNLVPTASLLWNKHPVTIWHCQSTWTNIFFAFGFAVINIEHFLYSLTTRNSIQATKNLLLWHCLHRLDSCDPQYRRLLSLQPQRQDIPYKLTKIYYVDIVYTASTLKITDTEDYLPPWLLSCLLYTSDAADD